MTDIFSKQTKPSNWLTRDYQIRPDYRSLGLALIFVLLSNVLFLVGAYLTGIARPIINVDYLAVCILWAIPHRLAKWVGTLSFVVAVLIDAMMMAMQLFPFLDISAAISLAPFLVNAPLRYMVMTGVVVGYIVLMPVLMIWLSRRWFVKKWSFLYVVVWAVIGVWGYTNFNEFRYMGVSGERFAQSDYFYIHSQYKRYRHVADSGFAGYFNQVPQMIPIDVAYISHHFGAVKSGIVEPESRPLVTADTDRRVLGDKGVDIGDDVPRQLSDKMLLIVAESWGVARDSNAQKDILAGIYAHRDNFDFLDAGYFGFAGATVEGELRELCQLDVESGYAFSRLDDKPFADCLPNRLRKQGYQTIGMHAGFSSIYERNFLYPKMGFDKTIFAENYNHLKHCTAFNGVCDSEMFDVVAKEFKENNGNKLFFYWLTLTSHASFPEKDMVNPRFDCDKYGIPKGDICNNFRLEAQYFDGLSKLLEKPEMRGVEVIVVGDHMPPIFTRHPIHPYLQWQDVSWVHFKVKD